MTEAKKKVKTELKAMDVTIWTEKGRGEGEREKEIVVITIRDHWKAAERFFFPFKGQSNICACLNSEGKELVYKERKY